MTLQEVKKYAYVLIQLLNYYDNYYYDIRMTVASPNKTPRTIAGVLLQPSADKTTATTMSA